MSEMPSFLWQMISGLAACTAGVVSLYYYRRNLALTRLSNSARIDSVGEFVYVNQDGSVRELALDEREYLSESFHPGDGGRPYIKSSYGSVDGWGSPSGFLRRRMVPANITIEPVNPAYVPPVFDGLQEMIEKSRHVGDIVTEEPDGSVRVAPNPDIPPEKRFELMREITLERQREHEKLAKHPSYVR